MWSIIIFVVSATVVVVASSQMAKYGDVIAIKTGLGRLFIGTVLLAAATSLPELLTNIASVRQDLPDLAAGNLMGSCIFNIVIIAALDIAFRRIRILRNISVTHALTAAFGIALLGMTALFMLARLDVGLFGFGLDSLVLILVFLLGLYLIRAQGKSSADADGYNGEPTIGLPRALFSFGVATLILWFGAVYLVRSSEQTAALLGVGTGFFGVTVLAIVTSLPEVMASVAAVRLGAYDMAVGNLFGSNMFNIMTLAVIDGFYLQGYFLSDVNTSFVLAALVAMLLTVIALIGTLSRRERRLGVVETDAVVIVIGYVLGMVMLYVTGIRPA